MSGLKQRVTASMAKYGKVGVATYIGLGLGNWFLWYSLIKMGVDIKGQAQKLGFETNTPGWDKLESAGPVVGGYFIHKMTAPVRLPLTLAIIPVVARFVGQAPK